MGDNTEFAIRWNFRLRLPRERSEEKRSEWTWLEYAP
jgi:hypothetical protein